MTFELFHRLRGNGWKMKPKDLDDYSRYSLTVLSQYDVTCYACIAEYPQQLSLNGHYGVSWIECTYEIEAPYDMHDLEDMMKGIELAEDNLLRCGVPFVPYYEFHGKNRANKKRKNDKIRRELKLDEIENRDMEELE